jgi:hypothetical protein
MREKKPYSIIGLNRKQSDIKYYHCQIHQGSRLIPYPEENGLYLCTSCGIPYNPNDLKSDTKITSRFAVSQGGTKISSGHNRSYKQKDYFDQSGHKLPKDDPDILRDIAAGRTIVYYNTTEETDKKESTYTIKK